MSRRALVVGGTGAVGRAVVRALRARGVETAFTFATSGEAAAKLAADVEATPHRLDVRDVDAVRVLAGAVAEAGRAPDVVVYAVGSLVPAQLLELDDAAWDASYEVNARGAVAVVRAFAPHMPASGGDIVVVGGLDRAQSLPVPVAYAAGQGMVAGFTMAAAKELGPRAVRLNMVALGLLTEGLSLGLDPKVRAEFPAFSALRRFGTPEEAARAIAWLALENTFVTGKVFPVNGGI
jgi:3-oxoacyl-[acyl-carrier protein] reductase